MKKIILLLLVFVSILTFSSGCDAKSNNTSLEFKEFKKLLLDWILINFIKLILM